MRKIILVFFSFILSVATLSAQDGCDELAINALELANNACGGLGRNEVCYGFNLVEALDFDFQTINEFSDTGDIVPISNISSIVTTPFNSDDETWGIAVLSVQANFPDTLPGQNVTILLFGDTEISADEAVTDESIRLSAQATGNINVRSGAGTNYVVVAGLTANQSVTTIGRNSAGDWLLIEFDDGNTGWVFADLMNVDGDSETLSVRATATSSPMQAFHIKTGIGSPSCEDIPQDGLLIQAPQDTEVTFLINGIEVNIGSTALIRADEETMTVSTFDGEVILGAKGVSETITPGLQSSVASGEAPTKAEPYQGKDVLHVPVNLLPEHVDIPPPVGQEINITQCHYRGGSVTVNNDSPIILRTGWATSTMSELQEFMDAVTLDLTDNGANQPLWNTVGPSYDPNRGDYPYFTFWYWVIENPEVGTHQLRVDYDFSRAITIGDEANVSSYDSLSCQLVVQE